jgi:hypothetical protein
MGEGSEAPVAAVFEALAHVALGAAGADTRLAETLDALDAIDAQGALAHALNTAALMDVRAGRLESAEQRAEHALRAAERVGRKTEFAFAHVLLAEVALAQGRGSAVRAQIESLLPGAFDTDVLDARTRSALRAVARQLDIEVSGGDLPAN